MALIDFDVDFPSDAVDDGVEIAPLEDNEVSHLACVDQRAVLRRCKSPVRDLTTLSPLAS